MNSKSSLNPGMLSHWLERIFALKITFTFTSFCHVYREKNKEANRLSKRGLEGTFGVMHYELINKNSVEAVGKVNFF